MRRITLPLLASAFFAAAAFVPASASPEESPAVRSARAASGTTCFVASRHFAHDVEVAKGWDDTRRAAFLKLRAAADAFASAVALHETDRNLADGCNVLSAEAVELHIFRRTLGSLLAETRRSAPVMTFREADGALNAAYREVMAVGDPKDLAWGSVDKAGIRKAERAWIAYRDAFVAFAATVRKPGAAEQLVIDLTMQRTSSLEAFLAD